MALADMGVTTVIDLRAGTSIDPRMDDARFLQSLGIEYVSFPLPDGHAPSPDLVGALLSVIEQADGIVYLHCAAGVGRTTSVEMAYRANAGMDHGVARQLAVGPATIEQLWFVASLRSGRLRAVPTMLKLVSRALDSPRLLGGRLRHLVAKTSSRERTAAR